MWIFNITKIEKILNYKMHYKMKGISIHLIMQLVINP
jgi:hypothetical protein